MDRIVAHEILEEEFHFIVRELTNVFPELDLRFNLQAGSNRIRYQIADVSHDTYEAQIGAQSAQNILNEAILNIKAIARRFDA